MGRLIAILVAAGLVGLIIFGDFERHVYDRRPEFGADPTPFVVMLLLGFVVGVGGHIVRSKTMVAIGIGMIFLATLVLPLAVNLSSR